MRCRRARHVRDQPLQKKYGFAGPADHGVQPGAVGRDGDALESVGERRFVAHGTTWDRVVGKDQDAAATFEERFCAATVGRLSAATRSRLYDLIAEDASTDAESGRRGTFLTELKADPGALGPDSLPT